MNSGDVERAFAASSEAAKLAARMSAAKYSHFMQDPRWSLVSLDERETWRPVVSCDASGEGRAASLVRVAAGTAGLLKGFVDGGPTFDDVEDLQPHLAALRTAARDCIWIRLRPYVWRDECTSLAELLQDSGYQIHSEAASSWYCRTAVIDLDRSLESIHAAFSTALRRNLRRADRAGLRFERAMSGKLVSEFANLLPQSARLAGYPVPGSKGLTRYLSAVLSADSTRAALFVLRQRGRVVAGITVLPAGSAAVYHWGARDQELDQGLPLTHLLHWAAIQWARESGFRYYDFGGLKPEAARNGIDRFKLSFGCKERALIGEATLLIRPFVARASTAVGNLACRLGAQRFRI